MDYSTWTSENLAAERRALEQRNKELQQRVESLTRLAISSFDERDRRVFGGSSYDSQGKRYQQERDQEQSKMSQNSQAIRAIEEELQRR